MPSGSLDRRLGITARRALWAMALLGATLLAVLMSWERAGWTATVTAAAVYAGAALLVRRGWLRNRATSFGAANAITLARAAITAVLLGVAIETLAWRNPNPAAGAAQWGIAAIAALAWVMDAVDGCAARRLGETSAFGARFDMEVDALFILALSLMVYGLGRAGPWVLLAGLMRYLFAAATTIWPALAIPLPPSFRRKAICAVMGGTLVVATFPPISESVAAIILGIGVGTLLWSFAVDTVTLLRRTRTEPAAARIGR